MKKILLLLSIIPLLLACHQTTEQRDDFYLQGAWMLRQMDYPYGRTKHYELKENGTYCMIYDGDSLFYECFLTTTPSGLVVKPCGKATVTLVDKGGGQLLYLEDGDPHPLSLNGDSLTIQRYGILLSWLRADSLYQEWGSEIRDIVGKEQEGDMAADAKCYFLSVKERQQERTILWLALVTAFIVVMSLTAAYYNHKARHQLQLQLHQIQEVQAHRPQAVRQAVASVESQFFASDAYATLLKRMASGERLKEDEWGEVEQHLKSVYPGFASQLRSLHPMSQLEYQVCLLIKLRIQPKDIAAVLARDVSTISTVRSRLYKKVFARKGGAKDWDDFLMTIGT